MSEVIVLSLEKSSYEDERNVLCEIMDSNHGYLYFQRVDGCGYSVILMTPQEALEIAEKLKETAKELLDKQK